MEIKSNYRFYFGAASDLMNRDSSKVIRADTLDEIKRKMPVVPGIVPCFLLVYQDTQISVDSEFFAKFLSLAQASYSSMAPFTGDNVHPKAIEIGYEPHFPKEMVASTFSRNGHGPNLDRLLVTEIGQLPDVGKKDLGETINILDQMGKRLRKIIGDTKTIPDPTETLKDLGIQLFSHLKMQRSLYGLDIVENGLYLRMKDLYSDSSLS